MTGTLDGNSEFPLMPCAGSRYTPREDLSSFGDESAEPHDILVVDVTAFFAAECAYLLFSAHTAANPSGSV